MSLPPFITKSTEWKEFLKGKHLLFDTDAISNIQHFSPEDFFSTLKTINVTNCIINPVYLELMNTNKDALRVSRNTLIDQNNFHNLPITPFVINNAVYIQMYLSTQKCFPSTTDLYLASTLSRFEHDNIVLITRNIKDFPHPLFNRNTYIVFQDEKNICTLSLITMDKNQRNIALK